MKRVQRSSAAEAEEAAVEIVAAAAADTGADTGAVVADVIAIRLLSDFRQIRIISPASWLSSCCLERDDDFRSTN